LILILLTLPSLCCAEVDEDFTGYETGTMMNQTRDALLSYDLIQEKTNFWGKKLEKMLLGGYTEKFLIFAPLITGKVEFRALDVNFYVDTRRERGGVKYTYNF
jgi:hypothetical protein